MKLITKLFSVLSILCTSLYVIFSNLNSQTESWNNFGKKGNYAMTYVRFFEKNNEEIYEAITSAAKENKVNIIKTDLFLEKSNISNINISVFLTNPQINLFEGLNLISGNYFDIEKTEEDVFISTRSDPNALGKVFDFFESNDVKIGTLKSFLNKGKSLKSEYVVKYLQKEDYNCFIKSLSQKLMVNEESLIKKSAESLVDGNSFELISKIGLIICILLTFITSVFYSVKKIKDTGIMKLCGWNFLNIFINLFGGIFNLLVIFSVAFNFLLLLFFKNVTMDFILTLLAHQFFIIFLIFMGTVPSLILLKKYKISDMIHNRNPTKLVFGINFLIKQVITVLFMSISYFAPRAIRELPSQIEKMNIWNSVSELATLRYVGKNHNAFIGAGGDPTESIIYKKISDFLDEKGAIYTDFFKTPNLDDYRNEDNIKEKCPEIFDKEVLKVNEKLRTLKVNPNYLDNFKVKDLEGNFIKIDRNSDSRFILKPKSSLISEKALEIIYNFYLKGELYGQEKFRKIKYNYTPNIKVLVYDDSDFKIPTITEAEDEFQNTDCKFFEKSLFFEVVPAKLMTLDEATSGSAGNRGLKNTLKVNTNGKSALEFHKNMLPEFERMNIKASDYGFCKIKDILEDETNLIRRSIKFRIYSLILLLSMIILISLQSIKVYLETYKRQITIKKIHGWNMFDRYKTPSIISLAFTTISIFLASLIVKIQGNVKIGDFEKDLFNPQDMFLLGIAFIALDIFISFLIIRNQENKKIPKTIKEG